MSEGGLPPTLNDEWAKFLADPGNGIPELFAHHLLFPLQRRKELEQMVAMAAKINPKTLLVIGGDKGGDLFSFIRACPTLELVITIEIRGTPYVDLFAKAFPHLDVFGISASSYDPSIIDTVRAILEVAGEKIDVAFLDGDKLNYDKDFHAYSGMMRAGGLMFLHDCHPSTNPVDFPCRVFFDNLMKSHRHTSRIVDTSEHDEVKDLAPGEHFENSYRGWLHYWKAIPTCGVGVVYF